METANGTHEVVVLGGGYAGIVAARRIAKGLRGERAKVTLVSRDAHFVERVRMHELAGGKPPRPVPIEGMLRGTDAAFVQGVVRSIDLSARTVELFRGRETHVLSYQTLVYALGSTTARDEVVGVREHTHHIGSERGATAARTALADLACAATAGRRPRVVVVGDGLTGIEAAAELAEAYPSLQLHVVTRSGFGAAFSERGRRHLQHSFRRMDIMVQDDVDVRQVEAGRLRLDLGADLEFDLCLWAGAFTVPDLARAAGLAVNQVGQALVDGNLRSLSHQDVIVVGDAAAVTDPAVPPLRMACATAAPMAAHAADAFVARRMGQQAPPLRFAYTAQCVALGRRNGLIQLLRPDGTPAQRVITGRPAAFLKELVNRYARWVLTCERLLTCENWYLARIAGGQQERTDEWRRAGTAI